MVIGRTDKKDKIDVIEKRLEITVGAKLRDKSRLESAIPIHISLQL